MGEGKEEGREKKKQITESVLQAVDCGRPWIAYMRTDVCGTESNWCGGALERKSYVCTSLHVDRLYVILMLNRLQLTVVHRDKAQQPTNGLSK